MTLIKLVVCTVGRASELERLLVSLDHQTCQDFEVLVVDQNADNRLDQILRLHPNLRIAHLQSEPGLSRARNVALSHVAAALLRVLIVDEPGADLAEHANLLETGSHLEAEQTFEHRLGALLAGHEQNIARLRCVLCNDVRRTRDVAHGKGCLASLQSRHGTVQVRRNKVAPRGCRWTSPNSVRH